MSIKHKKVTTSFYSIVLRASNRQMPSEIDDFFSGFDFDKMEDEDAWSESHVALRDYEGDFEGIEIYPDDRVLSVYQYIANKLGIDILELDGISIKITNI